MQRALCRGYAAPEVHLQFIQRHSVTRLHFSKLRPPDPNPAIDHRTPHLCPRKYSEGQSRNMATKYAFTRSLKEVRFLFCQTSEQSAATR